MDNKIVVGVGNIYANETLFLSGIRPKKPAGREFRFDRYKKLVGNVREVLLKAIDQGGTTLKDFSGNEGKSGYFKQELFVYGRGGKALSFSVKLDTERGEARSAVLGVLSLLPKITFIC